MANAWAASCARRCALLEGWQPLPGELCTAAALLFINAVFRSPSQGLQPQGASLKGAQRGRSLLSS